MGIVDGTPVDAATTNPAFLDANADDTALGKITLNNIADPSTSGPQVTNIQRELNGIATFTGKTTNTPYLTTPSWSNNDVGTASDNVKVRADYLTAKFNGTSGHAHTGAAGDGPLLSGGSLTGVPLEGHFNQGISLIGVTGGSTNISTEMTGKTASSGSSVQGVVVTAPYNKVFLRDNTTGDLIQNGSGDQIYGRITESVGVWTLTYYYMNGAVETAYSFGIAQDIAWYYQELYNKLTNSPVYSELAQIPSDNATQDVLDASETQAGKVLLANVAPPSISNTNTKGTSTRVAHQDHTHEGVHSMGIFGNITQLLGDVQLEAGPNITLTFSSGRIKIESTASGGSPTVEYRTLTSGEATAKSLTLSATPAVASSTLLDAIGGGAQEYSVDYSVSGSTLSWSGLGLDGILSSGDKLRIVYWT